MKCLGGIPNDDNLFIAGSDDKSLKIWNIDEGKLVINCPNINGTV